MSYETLYCRLDCYMYARKLEIETGIDEISLTADHRREKLLK